MKITTIVHTLIVFAWVAPLSAFAQETESIAPDTVQRVIAPGRWHYGATTGLNLSQSAFSTNWSGGDMGSIAWVLNSDLTAERQFGRIFNLTSQLQLAYGQSTRQTRDTLTAELTWDRPEKTTDLIQFESTGRFSLDSYVDPYFAVQLETQFNDESDPAGNILFNPIKLKESAGIARVLVKNERSTVISRLGFGFRQTFGRSIVDGATRATDRFVSNDGGFEWQTAATHPILDGRVLFKGRLLLFQPVFYSKSSDLEAFDRAARDSIPGREAVADFWRATDVVFQSTFSAEITEHLQVNLFVQWVYDKFDTKANVDGDQPLASQFAEIGRNVRKRGQFKETLALGVVYRLF